MLNNKYKEFIQRYVRVDKNATISSNQIYHLFCSVYDITSTELNIKTFIPNVKKHIEDLYNIKLEHSKRRQGSRTIRGFKGLTIDFIQSPIHASSMTHSLTPQMTSSVLPNTSTQTSSSSSLVLNENDDAVVDSYKDTRKTRLNIVDFIKKYYEKGDENSIIASDEIYNLCLDYYKNSPSHIQYISSKNHFTPKLKKSWNLVYPNHELQTSDKIRDPQDKTKRGIARIKRKGS